MYNKVLVPLDGSKLAEAILEHVTAITDGCQAAEVVLLLVVERAEHGATSTWGGVVSAKRMAEVERKAKAEARDYLAKTAGKLKREGMAVKTSILQGNPADKILDYTGENQVDLIVMSTHGRSGIKRWAFGSVADRVAHHSPVPVLLVSPSGFRAGH